MRIDDDFLCGRKKISKNHDKDFPQSTNVFSETVLRFPMLDDINIVRIFIQVNIFPFYLAVIHRSKPSAFALKGSHGRKFMKTRFITERSSGYIRSFMPRFYAPNYDDMKVASVVVE